MFLLYRNKEMELTNITKEVDSLNSIRNESKTKLAMHKDQVDTEKNKLQLYHEEDMVPLCSLYNQLLR